tara:strand:+ start:687 stop:851 length:165 start_codon:yes stop_codon:yes gene_type:complete
MKYYYLFLFSLLIIVGTCFVSLIKDAEQKHQAEKQYIQPSYNDNEIPQIPRCKE